MYNNIEREGRKENKPHYISSPIYIDVFITVIRIYLEFFTRQNAIKSIGCNQNSKDKLKLRK